jgi:hypothetical protein
VFCAIAVCASAIMKIIMKTHANRTHIFTLPSLLGFRFASLAFDANVVHPFSLLISQSSAIDVRKLSSSAAWLSTWDDARRLIVRRHEASRL